MHIYAYICSDNIKDRDVTLWHKLASSLKFVLSKFGINICNSLETTLFGNVAISVIFNSFFIITFDWWFHRKDLVQIYQNWPYFKSKNIFLSIQINFKWKMNNIRFSFAVFSNLLPKFRDFINSDDYIWKITSKSIRLYPFLFL